MKKLAIIAAAILALSSCSALSKINWNEAQLAQAATTALTAASISDAQVIALSQKTVAELAKRMRAKADATQGK